LRDKDKVADVLQASRSLARLFKGFEGKLEIDTTSFMKEYSPRNMFPLARLEHTKTHDVSQAVVSQC
jgi:hypothetical protein